MSDRSSTPAMHSGARVGQRTLPAATQATAGGGLPVLGALLCLYLIWGSTYLGIRVALESFPPLLMGAIRFLCAGSLLFLFLLARGTPMPTRRQWAHSVALGLLLLFGGFGLVTFAEQRISSSLAALCIGVTPLWTALFAGLFGHWPGRLEWVGLGIGFGGIVLLNVDGNLHANPLGAVLLLVAAACWAFGSVISPKLSLPPGMMSSAAEMLAGGVILLLIGLARGEHLHAPSAHSVLALIYLSVIGSLVAFSAYTFLLTRVRPALATSYAYVNPAVAVVLGVGLAGEHITILGLCAIPFILGGVALVALHRPAI